MDVFFHFLHVVSVTVWVGGQLFLGLVLGPTIRQFLGPRERMPLSMAIALRFKRVGHVALGVLVLTGLWRVRYLFQTGLASFVDTTYGRVFLLKMVLFVAMVALGVVHDKVHGPSLAALAERPDSPEYRAAARRMMGWARFNVLVALAVVFCGVLLRHLSF